MEKIEFRPVWWVKIYNKNFQLIGSKAADFGADKEELSELVKEFLEEKNGEYAELVTAYARV